MYFSVIEGYSFLLLVVRFLGFGGATIGVSIVSGVDTSGSACIPALHCSHTGVLLLAPHLTHGRKSLPTRAVSRRVSDDSVLSYAVGFCSTTGITLEARVGGSTGSCSRSLLSDSVRGTAGVSSSP